MKRAAVLIGVDTTGGLPRLSDAAAGAERMEAWALAQGLARKDVMLLTDREGPVALADIKKAVRALVDKGTVEQLLVYFAGHGVMIRRGEYWLLSGAPDDAGEAINATGSAAAAAYCGIPHVVFVSDACRTAAAGLQAQSIEGGEIFPNQISADPSDAAVDWFYATTVGKPALEVRADGSASTDFRAVYTATLLDALSGRLAPALAPAPAGSTPAFVVRPWPLRDCLVAELPLRIGRLGLAADVTQKPVAVITSRPERAWLAGFAVDPAGAAAAVAPSATVPSATPLPAPPTAMPPPARSGRWGFGRGAASAGTEPAARRGAAPDPAVGREAGVTRTDAFAGRAGATAGGDLVGSRAAPSAAPPVAALVEQDAIETAFRDAILGPRAAPPRPPPTAIFRTTRGAAAPPPPPPPPPSPHAQSFGPMSFETGRGFKLRGATVARATAPGIGAEVFDDDRSVVRVGHLGGDAGLVLLELAENGTGLLLPTVRDWIVAIDVVDGEVTTIAWEPSASSARYADFVGRAEELRVLRAAVAEAAREGVFRLDETTAGALAPRMQSARSVDPALGLYAAYAYHQIRDDAALQHLASALRADLGVGFFDLELLSRRFAGGGPRPAALPPFPMLQQGWNLLAALGAPLPPALAPLGRELVDALWTQFTPDGAARLRRLVEKGTLP